MPKAMMIWPGNPGLSIFVWAILAIVVMYAARIPAHQAIRGFTRVVAHTLRLAGHSLMDAQKRLALRNREVLLASGQELTERQIEQEFSRISTTIAKDLGTYPALHRKLSEQVASIDEDYRAATDSPPDPPAWTSAIGMTQQLVDKSGGDKTVGRVIEALHKGFMRAHAQAMGEYRKSSRTRHRLLSHMMPFWRRTASTLASVDKTVNGIVERSNHIDKLMEQYHEISKRSDRAERMLSTSAMTQFLISGLVLTIAVLGGFINFQLIALPMSEMVGASARLGSLKVSQVAALVIIMVEITMGLFLMESLRITRLFPVIGSMQDRNRRIMMWASLVILLVLASIESSLAYMRDLLAANNAALTQSLAGIAVQQPEFHWIPAVGQMTLGFILPFALTFVAVPMESFIHSLRVVGGNALEAALRLAVFACHLAGSLIHHLGSGLINTYDLAVFLPLKVEHLVLGVTASKTRRGKVPAA
ncbi:MAG: hypothetical protein OEW11_02470 [Nitrospirota bacterium]|nr:hypothetical protein [Nitrospirota bacterium]